MAFKVTITKKVAKGLGDLPDDVQDKLWTLFGAMQRLGPVFVGVPRKDRQLLRCIMLVAVRKPRIKVRLTGVGAQTVVKALRQIYDSVEVSRDDEAVDVTSTDWWKKMEASSHTGTVLWTYRDNAGLTLEQLSKLSGIARPHLSAMENGKRPIGTLTAKKLATALGVDHRVFL